MAFLRFYRRAFRIGRGFHAGTYVHTDIEVADKGFREGLWFDAILTVAGVPSIDRSGGPVSFIGLGLEVWLRWKSCRYLRLWSGP